MTLGVSGPEHGHSMFQDLNMYNQFSGPEHTVHEFLERWNQSHLYLHPKTQFHMLRSLRIQQPASVDYSHVITSCHDEFTSHSLHVEDMTRIYEEVKGQGVLGITCYQLQVCWNLYFRLQKIQGNSVNT